MIFDNRNKLIDQYRNGMMNADQARDFERRLERDETLRSLYEADESISAAIHFDKSTIPPAPGAPPADLLAAVAATPPITASQSLWSTINAVRDSLNGSMVTIGVAGLGIVGITAIVLIIALAPEPTALPDVAAPAEQLPERVLALPADEPQAVEMPGSESPHIRETEAAAPEADQAEQPCQTPLSANESPAHADQSLSDYLGNALKNDSMTVLRNDSVRLNIEIEDRE